MYYRRTSHKRPQCKGLLRGGRLRESDRKGQILSNLEWSGIFTLKKVFFPLPIPGRFYDTIISSSLWQFIYGSAMSIGNHMISSAIWNK